MNAPTTLPADFGEWDSGDTTPAQPVKPATARVAVPPVVDRVPAPVSRKSAAAYAEAEQVFQPSKPKAEKHKDESKGKKKLMPLIGAGALTFVLVVGFMTYSRIRSSTPAPKPTVVQQPAATNTPQQVATNPLASTPAPTPATTGEDRQRAQSEMMNRQLNAPSRIPTDLKMLAGKEPPPSSGFAASGLDGLGGGGGTGNVFSGQNGPKVKIAAPTKVSISAGVAGGLLVQKTSPVYPQIAREARVSGTVVIQATISKTGVIQNLRAVSGPTMLRQAALDAVKTWRYNPYMLDGQPVDVETTVSVTFTLGG
ncbi:MAG: TonB family protein [Terracidiphilus sp.]